MIPIEVLEITQVQLPIYRWIGIFIALISLAWSTYILIKDKCFTAIFFHFYGWTSYCGISYANQRGPL